MIMKHTKQSCAATKNNAPLMTYEVNSNVSTGLTIPRRSFEPKSLKKDINDTIQQAALINMVASANEDFGTHNADVYEGSHKSDLGNNLRSVGHSVAIGTNIVLPRDRTVSIPQSKQSKLNLTEDSFRRKPVYYKHSNDLEVQKESHISQFEESEGFHLKVQNNVGLFNVKGKLTSDAMNKSLSKKQTISDKNVRHGNNQKKLADDRRCLKSRDKESMCSSGIRPLGSLKNSRQVQELPKCDAIDFLDKNNNAINEIVEDTNIKVENFAQNKIPYVRTKSLPIIFPAKSNRALRSAVSTSQMKQRVVQSQPIARSLRKLVPQSMYRKMMSLHQSFGICTLSINKSMHQVADRSTTLLNRSEKHWRPRICLGGPSSRTSSASQRSKSLSNFSQHAVHMYVIGSNPTQNASRELDLMGKTNLHSRTMSGSTVNSSTRATTSGRTRRSCLASAKTDGTSRNTSAKTDSTNINTSPKRVKFHGSNGEHFETSRDKGELNKVSTNINQEQEVHEGTLLFEMPESPLMAYIPAIHHMSVQELSKFRRKICYRDIRPNTTINSGNFFSTSFAITLRSLNKSNDEIFPKIQMDGVEKYDNNKASAKQVSQEIINNTALADNRNNSELNSTTTDSTKHQCPSLKKSDDEDNDNEDNMISEDDEDNNLADNSLEFYKLVKAIDRNSYDGFEHRKMRRFAVTSGVKESDSTKAHYVKIKIG